MKHMQKEGPEEFVCDCAVLCFLAKRRSSLVAAALKFRFADPFRPQRKKEKKNEMHSFLRVPFFVAEQSSQAPQLFEISSLFFALHDAGYKICLGN